CTIALFLQCPRHSLYRAGNPTPPQTGREPDRGDGMVVLALPQVGKKPGRCLRNYYSLPVWGAGAPWARVGFSVCGFCFGCFAQQAIARGEDQRQPPPPDKIGLG